MTAGESNVGATLAGRKEITLLAPEVDGWLFDAWVLTPGGTLPGNRLVTITLNTNITATPRYTQ